MVSLAALAAGAMPELFLPPDRARSFASPPALGLMLAVQVVFVLMFCTAQWADPRRSAAMTVVALVAATVAVGGPVACYLLAELADSPAGAAWLRRATPAVFAFGLARRSPDLLATPLWAWLLWPAVGALAAAARMLVPRPAGAGVEGC